MSNPRRCLCEREAKNAGRIVSDALNSILAKVKAAGVSDPALFFEPESHAIFVMDRSHNGYINSDRCSASERQAAIVAAVVVQAADYH